METGHLRNVRAMMSDTVMVIIATRQFGTETYHYRYKTLTSNRGSHLAPARTHLDPRLGLPIARLQRGDLGRRLWTFQLMEMTRQKS